LERRAGVIKSENSEFVFVVVVVVVVIIVVVIVVIVTGFSTGQHGYAGLCDDSQQCDASYEFTCPWHCAEICRPQPTYPCVLFELITDNYNDNVNSYNSGAFVCI